MRVNLLGVARPNGWDSYEVRVLDSEDPENEGVNYLIIYLPQTSRWRSDHIR